MNKNLKEIISLRPWIGKGKEAILKAFETEDQTCLIIPTGLGKTVTASAVLVEMKSQEKALYLAPTIHIVNQTKKSFRHFGVRGVDLMTYPDMHARVRRGELEYFKDYSMVILDEFHRLGATEWGKSWNEIDSGYPGKKVLGLTATETRYLDGGRDMALEIFKGNIAYKKLLGEAWAEKCYFAPIYALATDLESELGKAEDRLVDVKDPEKLKEIKKEIKHLRENWQSSKGMAGVFKKHLGRETQDLKRLVVFHESIAETGMLQRKLQDYLEYAGYDKIRFYYANTGVNNGTVEVDKDGLGTSEEEVLAFNDTSDGFDGLKVILSIGMLSEGLHPENCRAEVMFRSTISKNIFLQQIGRVMSPDHSERPIILDCVQNLLNIDYIQELPKSKHKGGKHVNRSEHEEDPYELRVISEIIEVTNLSKYIDEASNNDLDLIEAWYSKYEAGEDWIEK